MAQVCAFYHLRPLDYWDLDADDEAALVSHMNDVTKARSRAAQQTKAKIRRR